MKIFQTILFSKEECDYIINCKKENFQIWNNNSDRNYTSESIYLNDENKFIFERLNNLIDKKTSAEILSIKNEAHFHTYNTNGYFSKHKDNRNLRVYSIGIILNDNFTGGNLIIYNNNSEIKIDNKVGNAFFFESKFKHEVTPITNGVRYSLIYFLELDNVALPINSLI